MSTTVFCDLSILSVAHVDAPRRVTSAELEDRYGPTSRRLGLPSGLLSGLSGVRERRFWDAGLGPREGVVEAARRVLGKARLAPREIGVIVNTSVSREVIEPSTASIVSGDLGLGPDCLNFDLSDACLGFMTGIEVVGAMIERGQVRYGLIVNAESSSTPVEHTLDLLAGPEVGREQFWANFATLTLGSGAVAMVLGAAPASPHRLGARVRLAACEHHALCRGRSDAMTTDSVRLLKAGSRLVEQTWHAARRELGWTPESFDMVVSHQFSRAGRDATARILEVPGAKVPTLYGEFGNMGPATWPTLLSKCLDSSRVRDGMRLLLAGVASGLNCSLWDLHW
jgi:3-oxoacyl-[acyl-carrier-protein] synthase-3